MAWHVSLKETQQDPRDNERWEEFLTWSLRMRIPRVDCGGWEFGVRGFERFQSAGRRLDAIQSGRGPDQGVGFRRWRAWPCTCRRRTAG